MQVDIIFLGMLLVVSIGFLLTLFISIVIHKNEIKFYQILCREDGRVSKVSVAFIVILFLLVYQAVIFNSITNGLVELLMVVFAAELGVKGIDCYGKMRCQRNQEERNE